MKTTTVSELRNNYSQVLKWVAKGKEVDVTRRGKIVAKILPPSSAKVTQVDRSQSAALNRPAWTASLTAKESAEIISGNQSPSPAGYVRRGFAVGHPRSRVQA